MAALAAFVLVHNYFVDLLVPMMILRFGWTIMSKLNMSTIWMIREIIMKTMTIIIRHISQLSWLDYNSMPHR